MNERRLLITCWLAFLASLIAGPWVLDFAQVTLHEPDEASDPP